MRMRLLLSIVLVLSALSYGPSARPALQAQGDGCRGVVINLIGLPPAFSCQSSGCSECFTIGGDEGMECHCSPSGPYADCCRLTYFPMNPPSIGLDVSGSCQLGGCLDNGGACILIEEDIGEGDSLFYAKCKKTISGH